MIAPYSHRIIVRRHNHLSLGCSACDGRLWAFNGGPAHCCDTCGAWEDVPERFPRTEWVESPKTPQGRPALDGTALK